MIGNILIAVGVLVAAYFAVTYGYKFDTKVEERRRGAIQMSSAFRARGLDVFADFLEDYAVGDYSGMAKKLQNLGAQLSNPAAADALFAKVVAKVVVAKVADPAKVAEILSLLGVKAGE